MKLHVQIVFLLAILFIVSACRQDMHDQPRYEPLELNSFFADGSASRQLVEGTVARGMLKTDKHLYFGKVDGEPARTFPFEITAEVLERGRERYNIYCSPCHDQLGYGNGMIVQRGFRQPPSFHTDRLRQVAVGHIFDVISNGFGAMYDYSDRIKAADRWAIVAYVRTLQLSQNMSIEEIPEDKQQLLRGKKE